MLYHSREIYPDPFVKVISFEGFKRSFLHKWSFPSQRKYFRIKKPSRTLHLPFVLPVVFCDRQKFIEVLVHSLWEYKNKVQNWSLCWLCLALSYLVRNKTKNKNPFFCFFNFVRSFRDKKDVKICLAIGETKLRQISPKKKKLKFCICILYFVSHKEWP